MDVYFGAQSTILYRKPVRKKCFFRLSDTLINPKTGVNVIKALHLYFTRVAIVSLAENNSCTCKLQV